MTASTREYAHNPRLPRDQDSHPIQVLSVEESTVVLLDITPVSLRAALPASSDVVEIAASDACYIKFGDSSVVAAASTSRVFPLGAAAYKVPIGATHLAVIQLGGSAGTLSIARMY